MIDLENQEREIINLMFSQGISWLTAVRIRHKLSLAEVSKMLGISINSLKQIEKTERLSSNIKSKMAGIYGCPPELLICPYWVTAEHK
ncbi:helix-turn-helix domain-containing protein [Escherichia marmotae]|uniref:Helix-turn-helix transcriptional regulator n=1 Tax=Escherichia marmotae TaxID=1499973 RepID=A0A7L5X1V9_9ESCH|nr:helix-turn-helix transcriptional regulator [Escherichia marmotae]MCR6676904.1 helix-turn-helix transcriptional regulator [Escherichia marmotae]MED8812668.1 helix-turn-helix transcriptional regulator [Escherichia marmotae]MED9351066.1 helix-turn-helix transcriptional regulator [Escherichia marmotae]MED9359590.1 helix-turn-helix transcriptional regulator [Escherichia marmotae]QLP25716.1 helix-turn-helix transcriptional regulator [Escherichia marmotae]